MRRYRRFISNVASMVIVSLLYGDIVWALPDTNIETLAPQSKLVQEIERLDIMASLLLKEIFDKVQGNHGGVDLELLFKWLIASDNLHETLIVRKKGKKILVLARGLDIEFTTSQSEGSYKLPSSDIWVRIDYSAEPLSPLNYKQRTYIQRCQGRLANLLDNRTQIRYLDLDTVISSEDEAKDRLVSELARYLNSGNDKALILLGNYFDMKGLYNVLARQILDEVRLRNIFALRGFTYAGDTQDPRKFTPTSTTMLMPLYQFLYRRAMEHQYKDGKEVKGVPIVIEEFSPFFERDRNRIEDLEIRSWRGVDVVVTRDEIKERHYRNPVYIIREGGEIVGGIATTCMQIEGNYKRNIPPKYKELIASHNPNGDTIFDFSVFTDVNPMVRKKRYGDILALTTLEVAKLQGKREVIAASRAEVFAGLVTKISRFKEEISGLPKKERFSAALGKIREFLTIERQQRELPDDYQFTINEIADSLYSYFFSGRRKKVPFNRLVMLGKRFTRHHLETGDPFLDVFHHRLGAEDCLTVFDSRLMDIRGFGAQVYISYARKLQEITADAGDREGLARQIFGKYYEGLNKKVTVVKPTPKYSLDFSVFKRWCNLRDLAQRLEPVDILIIGGGIAGAGIARDASLRRLRVGLVEEEDFAGRASPDSRLVLKNILSANEKGALIANYTEVVDITYDASGKVNGAIVEDRLTGQRYTIKARVIINEAEISADADSVVTRILKKLRPLDRTRSTTDKVPLYGDERITYTFQEIAERHEIDIETAEYLVDRYGSRYTGVLGLTRRQPRLKERIIPNQPYIGAEIVYAVHFEMVVHLQDFLIRRTDIGMQDGITTDNIRDIARLLAAELGWTVKRIEEEVKDYVEHRRRMSVVEEEKAAGGMAFQARLKEEYIESGDSVIAMQDVFEITEDGGLDKKVNFDKFCRLLELLPTDVEKVLNISFKYAALTSKHSSRIHNLQFHLSAQYELPFGNNKRDSIVTLNDNALKVLPYEMRIIALAVGLVYEIFGHEASGGEDGDDAGKEWLLTSEDDVDTTAFIIEGLADDVGKQLVLYLKYLESLREIVDEDGSLYLTLLSEDYRTKCRLLSNKKIRAVYKVIDRRITNERGTRKWEHRLRTAIISASRLNERLKGMYADRPGFLVCDVNSLGPVEIRITAWGESLLFWVDKEENVIYISEELMGDPLILLTFLLRHALEYIYINSDDGKAELRRNDLAVYFSLKADQQKELVRELDIFEISLINDISGERLKLASRYYTQHGRYRWQDELRKKAGWHIGKAMETASAINEIWNSSRKNAELADVFIKRLRNLSDIVLSLPNGSAISGRLQDLIKQLEDLSAALKEGSDSEISINDLTRLISIVRNFIAITSEIFIPATSPGTGYRTFIKNLISIHPLIDFVIIYAREKPPQGLKDKIGNYLGNVHPVHIRYTRQDGYYTVILAIPRNGQRNKLNISALKKMIGSNTDIIKIQAIFGERERTEVKERRYLVLQYKSDDTPPDSEEGTGFDAATDRIVQWISSHEQRLSNWDRIKEFLSGYWKKEPIKLLLGTGILLWISFIWIIFELSTFNSPFAYLENAMLTGLTYISVIFILTVIYHLILGVINWKNPFLAREIGARSRWVWRIGLTICVVMIALWPILGDVYLLALEAPYLHDALHILPLTLAIGTEFGGIVLNEGMGIIGTLLNKLSPFISESIGPLSGFAMQRRVLDPDLISATMAKFLSPAVYLLPTIIDLAIASIFVRKGHEKRNPVLIGYGLFLILGVIIYLGMHAPIGDFAMGGTAVYNILSNPNFNPRFVPIPRPVIWEDYYSLLIIIPMAILISLAISSVTKVINSIKERLGRRWFWLSTAIISAYALLGESGFRIIVTALIGLTIASGIVDFIYGIYRRLISLWDGPNDDVVGPAGGELKRVKREEEAVGTGA